MQKNERHKRVSPVLGLSLFLSGREMRESMKIIKELKKCIREYKKPSLITPIAVSLEVVMECIIPFIVAQLVNRISESCPFGEIAVYGAVLVVMAGLSLTFGAWAGSTCATASLRVCPQFAARICSIRFRHIPSATLINFPPLRW